MPLNICKNPKNNQSKKTGKSSPILYSVQIFCDRIVTVKIKSFLCLPMMFFHFDFELFQDIIISFFCMRQQTAGTVLYFLSALSFQYPVISAAVGQIQGAKTKHAIHMFCVMAWIIWTCTVFKITVTQTIHLSSRQKIPAY